MAERVSYESGTAIARFPRDGLILRASLTDDLQQEENDKETETPLLGVVYSGDHGENLLVFGDSQCLEDSAPESCAKLITSFIAGVQDETKREFI